VPPFRYPWRLNSSSSPEDIVAPESWVPLGGYRRPRYIPRNLRQLLHIDSRSHTASTQTSDMPAKCRLFHEKAGQVKIRSGRFSKTSDADQREARAIPASIPNYAIAESPRFHPHSWWSCLLRCQLVSSIDGCCHLGTELHCLCLQKRAFLADAAVTRTRRFATSKT
jgi:hypothetical protein